MTRYVVWALFGAASLALAAHFFSDDELVEHGNRAFKKVSKSGKKGKKK